MKEKVLISVEKRVYVCVGGSVLILHFMRRHEVVSSTLCEKKTSVIFIGSNGCQSGGRECMPIKSKAAPLQVSALCAESFAV